MELKLNDNMYCSHYGRVRVVGIGSAKSEPGLCFAPPSGNQYYVFLAEISKQIFYTTKDLKYNPQDFIRCIFTKKEAKELGVKLPPRKITMYQAILSKDGVVSLSSELYENKDQAAAKHGLALVGLSTTGITYEIEEDLK